MQELKVTHLVDVNGEAKSKTLYGVDGASQRTGVKESRLRELADARMVPHFRIDGGEPLFYLPELKKWISKSLIERVSGEEKLPVELRVYKAPNYDCEMTMAPQAIRCFKGLCEIDPVLISCGVYFLCQDNEVVYVGQSKSVASRIACHMYENEKKFDRVYILPVPASQLDDVEGYLIEKLNPTYNKGGAPKHSGIEEKHFIEGRWPGNLKVLK